MKKILVIALALVMALSLVACGGSKEEAKNETVQSENKVEQSVEDSVKTPAEVPSQGTASQKSDDSSLVGTWKLTKGKAMGIELNASDLGLNMAFVFNADGTASMSNDGETYEGLNWELIDSSTVRLSAYGQTLYDMTYDGNALTLHEPESDADLIFEK
ncbi:MAG: lipocalin family protein [Clostridia bacterium]|nr:lipocalin family protein [Clostridia bacterium]